MPVQHAPGTTQREAAHTGMPDAIEIVVIRYADRCVIPHESKCRLSLPKAVLR
jgi:hypothetical protein